MRTLVPQIPLPERARLGAVAACLLLLAVASPGTAAAADTGDDCRPSALIDMLPNVTAPAAGRDPIWLVGASLLHWNGGQPVKTAWVLSRLQDGPLVVTGHRRESPSQLSFVTDSGPTRVLEIAEPHGQSVVPGGASTAVQKEYSFVMSYLVFPTPGCWEIEARLGSAARRITVWIPDAPRLGR